MSNSLQPHETEAHQAPLSMRFSRKNTGCVAIHFSRGSSQPRDQTQVSHIAGRFFTIRDTQEAPMYHQMFSKSWTVI